MMKIYNRCNDECFERSFGGFTVICFDCKGSELRKRSGIISFKNNTYGISRESYKM